MMPSSSSSLSSSLYRRAAGLCLLLLWLSFTTGCGSKQEGDAKSGGDMNAAMSEQQKATIKAHKQQDGQQ